MNFVLTTCQTSAFYKYSTFVLSFTVNNVSIYTSVKEVLLSLEPHMCTLPMAPNRHFKRMIPCESTNSNHRLCHRVTFSWQQCLEPWRYLNAPEYFQPPFTHHFSGCLTKTMLEMYILSWYFKLYLFTLPFWPSLFYYINCHCSSMLLSISNYSPYFLFFVDILMPCWYICFHKYS